MISILSRKAMTVALLLFSAVAYATPFKNIHLELTVNETGRGRVYMQTEDPSNEQSRKSEDVVMKCTLGENGNDTLRVNESYMYPGAPATCIADSLQGLYMVWLNAEPEDGYELAGYSLIKKDNPDAYTKADLIKTTFTDNGNFKDPYADNDPYLCSMPTFPGKRMPRVTVVTMIQHARKRVPRTTGVRRPTGKSMPYLYQKAPFCRITIPAVSAPLCQKKARGTADKPTVLTAAQLPSRIKA